MDNHSPVAHLDPRFSSPDATAATWSDALDQLRAGEVFWIVTVRADGRPHVTPLLAVSIDTALYFATGPDEQKAKNLATNPHCALVLGHQSRTDGLDVVVEGNARRVTDEALLARLARAWEDKYGADWRFDVRDGGFVHAEGSLREADPDLAYVFEVAPRTAFGFGKGDTYSQTRWRF